MACSGENPRHRKISAAFQARLDRLRSGQKMRAVLLLHTKGIDTASGRRQPDAERQATIDGLRQASEPALKEIDDVLKHHDGKRLTSNVNALGSVPVETTAAGIAALAALEQVIAIVEDQPVFLSH